MRTLHALAFIGCGLAAVGCGGLDSGTSASAANSSAVSDSTNESADIAASFGQESSGVTAYALSTGVKPAILPANRAELVVALEIIAADTSACTAGSASITASPSATADCSNIGNAGSYPSGATLQFNNCTLANGGILNGTVNVAVTRALSAGATCGPSASIDVSHTVKFTNLAYTSSTGYILSYPTFNAVIASTHPVDAVPSQIALTSMSGERTITAPGGTLILDHKISGTGTVAFSGSSPVVRTSNGTFTVIHELLHFTAQAVLSNLQREETCCKPVGGSIDITLTPGVGTTANSAEAVSGTFEYGPTCGEITLDGRRLLVPECL